MPLFRQYFGDLRALAAVLAVNLACAVPIDLHMGRKVTLPELYYQALEFAHTHRIASDFLPIGYTALIGLGVRLTGSLAAIDVIDILISLAVVVAAWIWFRVQGSTVMQTVAVTLLLSLYPDFMLSFLKVEDTKLTELLLFAFMAALACVLRSRRIGWADAALAIVLAWCVLSRANLVLFLPLACGFLFAARVSQPVLRSILYLAAILLLYAGVTAAVHGRPFLPQNGPYNLYAGANPLTKDYLMNEEDSIHPSLLPLGIDARVDWSTQPDTPGVTDLRDSSFKPFYQQHAMDFMRHHVGTMIELCGLKFMTLLRPDLQVYHAGSLLGLIKIVSALGVPLWLLSLFLLPRPWRGPAGLILPVMIAVYIVPFVLTISTPRFALPLNLICWTDMTATLLARRDAKRFQPGLIAEPTG
jgi:hypothetical protein